MNHHEMDIRRRDFFNGHAENWMDMFYKNSETGQLDLYQQEFTRLFDLVGLHEGDFVLDCGCGCGILVSYILAHIGLDGKLLEVDYAERMIEVNRQLHHDKRVSFLVSSVDSIDKPAQMFDTVICFSCFPHFQRKTETLANLNRLLKSGGRLIIAHFGSSHEINDRHDKHECVMYDHLPSETNMRALIADTGFRVESFVDETGFYCLTAIKV